VQGSSAQAAAAAAAAAGRGKKRSFSQVAGELGSAHFHFFFIFFMSMETLVPVLRAGSPLASVKTMKAIWGEQFLFAHHPRLRT